MKILLLGKGFVGNRLFNFLKDSFDVQIFDKSTLDYTDRLIFKKILSDNSYNVVINCSGYTGSPNVDACEKEKEKCLFYNVSIPVQIARICDDQNVKFINISSGCIYTGYEKEFTEKDEPNFGMHSTISSYYSFTKHMCEILLRNTNAITIRIRMPFCGDAVNKNLIFKVLKYDNIIDLKNSGTSIDDLNVFIKNLIEHSKFYDLKGPLNVINPGELTCKMISEYLSFHGLTNPNWKIVDVSQLDIIAPRSNCVLSDKRIKKLGLQMPCLAKSLKEAVEKFASNYNAAI